MRLHRGQATQRTTRSRQESRPITTTQGGALVRVTRSGYRFPKGKDGRRPAFLLRSLVRIRRWELQSVTDLSLCGEFRSVGSCMRNATESGYCREDFACTNGWLTAASNSAVACFARASHSSPQPARYLIASGRAGLPLVLLIRQRPIAEPRMILPRFGEERLRKEGGKAGGTEETGRGWHSIVPNGQHFSQTSCLVIRRHAI